MANKNVENIFSNIFTIQNLVLAFSLATAFVIARVFLKSKTVKEVIENLTKLGSVQDNLLKAKDEELEQVKKEIERLEAELKDEKKENKRLRDYDFENRAEIEKMKREK